MKEWYRVDKIGNLYEETVLVRADEPVLFVCMDEEKNRYLVEAIDGFDGEFVIARIEDNVLSEMINNKIPMYDAFKRSEKLLHTSFDEAYNLKSKVYSNDEIPNELLPRKNAYFNLKSNQLTQYADSLQQKYIQIPVMYRCVSQERVRGTNRIFRINDQANWYKVSGKDDENRINFKNTWGLFRAV